MQQIILYFFGLLKQRTIHKFAAVLCFEHSCAEHENSDSVNFMLTTILFSESRLNGCFRLFAPKVWEVAGNAILPFYDSRWSGGHNQMWWRQSNPPATIEKKNFLHS